MFLPILLIIVGVLGALMLILSVTNKEKAGWVQFFAHGKDSGFSFKEIELLRRLAIKSHMEDPSALFWSQNQLDLCIRAMVKSMHLYGGADNQENNDFLSKLYDFRKKIEMNKPKITKGLSSTRQIIDGQNLRILVEGTGVFKSQIVKTTNQYIAISRPTNSKISGSFSWNRVKISVYFWRQDDAGYVFDSVVLDELYSKGIASLKIAHSDTLFRTQKRKSIRLKMHKSAFLYLITNEAEASVIEVDPGLKCFLEDLSDTGCAITVGGKASDGMRIKVQFLLNNFPICMSGTVRSVQYNEDLNRSLLHIEADHLPLEIRNKILGEVFGMLPEEEEDLPFRLLGEEADELAAGPDLGIDDEEQVLSDADDPDAVGTAV